LGIDPRESDQVVKIAGSVNNTMHLDGVATDDVKDEKGSDDQDPIPVGTEFGMSGNSSRKRMMFTLSNTPIHSVDNGKRLEGGCPLR
jgi:hypothetical protein